MRGLIPSSGRVESGIPGRMSVVGVILPKDIGLFNRTKHKKTRLSGAGAIRHTAPLCAYGARTMRSKALPKRMVHPHKAHGRYGQTSVRLHMVLSLFSSESMAVDTHAIRMKPWLVREPYKGGFA